MEISSNLKCCPYCGRKAYIDRSAWVTYDLEGNLKKTSIRFRVSCSKCGCCTEWKLNVDAALEIWNRRFVTDA